MKSHFCCLLFCASASILWASPIRVNSDFGSLPLGRYLHIHQDDSLALTIEDVLSNGKLHFWRQTHDQLTVGRRRNANIWVRAEIHNVGDTTLSLVLHANDVIIRRFSAYLTTADEVLEKFDLGLDKPFGFRKIPYRSTAIPLTISPGSVRYVYLAIENKWDPIQFPIFLSTERQFLAKVETEYLKLGIFQGLLGFMVLIALILFVSTRTRLFLIYLLYSLFTSVFAFGIAGLGFQYLFPNHPLVAYIGNLATGFIVTFMLFFLVIEYYRLQGENIGFAKKFIRMLLPVGVVVGLSVIFGKQLGFMYPEKNQLLLFIPTFTLAFISFFILYSLLRICIRSPKWNNLLFLAGYLGVTLFAAFYIPVQNGLFLISFDKYDFFRVSIVLEMMCISILMINRIFDIRREKVQLESEVEFARLEKERLLAIKALEDEKSKFYTNVTHEFRTPITVIKGMINQVEGHEEEKRLIGRNGDILLSLVNQLLDLSRSESEPLELHPVQGDVITYVKFLSDTFAGMCSLESIYFEVTCQVDTCIMDYDPDRLYQVLSNLLSNAVKNTDAGGAITLKVDRRADQLLIGIKDTGRGIAEEQLPFIFDRFYRADRGACAGNIGSGIGLAHTKMLVERMKGKIKVESRPGEGTTFIALLPITRNAPESLSIAPVESGPAIQGYSSDLVSPFSSGKTRQESDQVTILIIEDNPDLRHYLAKCLHEQYAILLAADGNAGLQLALEKMPDIILTDVMMPGIDGIEVCRKCKENLITSHIPIIMLTARATHEDKMEGLKTGADAYLVKPFDRTELLTRIENLIRQRDQMHEAFKKGVLRWSRERNEVDDQFLEKLNGTILENLTTTQFDVNQLAGAFSMSRTTLYRKVKQLTGMNIAAYRNHLRLQESLRLLKATEKTVSEIAYEVGFSSPSYFSRTFSDEFGFPPSKVNR